MIYYGYGIFGLSVDLRNWVDASLGAYAGSYYGVISCMESRARVATGAENFSSHGREEYQITVL